MKKNISGFTLIEMLVVIVLISILVLGMSRINFNYGIDKEKFLMLNNNIISNIESIRNNSLYGKAFSGGVVGFINPEKSTLSIKTGSGNDSFVLIHSGSSLQDNSYRIDFQTNGSIDKLDCKSITGSILDGDKNTVDIIFKGSSLSLSGCATNSKILDITTKYKSITGSILINTVSGLIEKK